MISLSCDTGTGTGATSGETSGGLGRRGGSSGSCGDGSQRKRRAAGSVSTMACTPCRQARQRCDGTRPSICGRCASRKLECVYEPHTKTHKDDLIKEIELLRWDNANLINRNREIEDDVAETETINRNLREEGSWQKIILETIGNNNHDREIISRLRAGDSHQAIADWLCQENPGLVDLGLEPVARSRLVNVVKIYEDQCQQEDGLHHHSSQHEGSQTSWTKVSSSHKLVGHLFHLYFAWVHPVHMLLSELDFKHDFRNNKTTYCSSSLVNAICAMACTLLENQNIDVRRHHVDATTLRCGFMNEARATLSRSTYKHWTSIQTFAVMFLVEWSCGKARNGTGYLRSAIENLEESGGPQHSEEAKQLTIWGLHTLNTCCASITYQCLYAPSVPREEIFQGIDLDIDAPLWGFYRHPGDEKELPTRPSHAIITACHQAKLFRIIDESLALYCGNRGQVSAEKMLSVYRRYREWIDDLPPVVSNVEVADQPLPHILYLHVQYHTALVQLFNPLIHCNFFSKNDQDELRKIVAWNARRGAELLHHARRLYSSRFFMPLLSFCLLHHCDALVRYSPEQPIASETVQFCLEVLQQTRVGFPLCGPLQSLFRQTAEECGVQVSHLANMVDSFTHYNMDDILDACTRLSYTQPLDQILRHFDPEIGREWGREWERQVLAPKGKGRRESSSGRYLQIDNILND